MLWRKAKESETMGSENQKAEAAKKALDFVKDGMILGLGTGSTSEFFVKFLAEKAKKENFSKLICASTSNKTTSLAESLDLKVMPIQKIKKIDLAVDGADEVDEKKQLLKGLGGYAFVKEKAVDYKAKKFVVIVDEAKLVKELSKPVLVECRKEKTEKVMKEVEKKFKAKVEQLMEGNEKKISENGNYLLSAKIENVSNKAKKLEKEIEAIEGVVGSGLFTRDCTVIVGKENKAEILK